MVDIGLVAVLAIALPPSLAAILWRAARSALSSPRVLKQNYRGADVPGSGGIVPVVVALGWAGFLVWWTPGDLTPRHGHAVLVALAGFGILGAVDDVMGGRSGGGFAGHLVALARGHLTTGIVKMVVGAMVAITAAAVAGGARPALESGWMIEVGRSGAIVALSANLLNLFDRAPGRSVKVAGGWWAALLVATAVSDGPDLQIMVWVTAALAAFVGVVGYELREELMLGDTGVNPLGATLGLGTVLVASPGVEWIVMTLLVALNLTSERVSFSAVIDAVGPLRRLDRLGSPYRS